jgi:phage terminase small subunit
MMPRTLPSAVKDAKGCYIKNPARRPKGEPNTGKGIGQPPSCLNKDEKKVWKKIVSETAQGVLQSSDRTLFILFVRLATKLYLNESMMVGEMGLFATLGSKFGMSPADRQKITVDQPKESNLAKFLAHGQKVVEIQHVDRERVG